METPETSFLNELRDSVKSSRELLLQLQQHARILANDTPEALERIVQERTELVVKMQNVTARLETCRDKWRRISDTTPPALRQDVESELAELARLVSHLRSAEEACAKIVASQKNETLQKLQNIANARKVDAAYKVKVVKDPTFVDRSE